MTRFGLKSAAFAAGAALILAACQDNPDPTSPALASSSQAFSAQAGELPSATEFARQVPGFGGFYLDASGAPTVYLSPGASRAAAERVLAGYLNARGLATAAVNVLEARYNWQELDRWQAAATPAALELSGTVFVDNDETSNRIVIGVEDLGSTGQVRAAIAQAGVPDEAVLVVQAAPIVQVATLQNVVDRPVRAGVQINFPGFLCSVGFNATSGTQKSFVTASHCTNTQGGVESTPYWQPLQSVDPTQIATEVADPVYARHGPGCPNGRRCRYSDAARAAYLNGANQALGLIAATSGANNGSLTITGSFTITSDDCNTTGGCLAVGSTANKVGRTTGWTAGRISNTCVNTGVSGTNIVQLCQTFVEAGVGGGDSGSDVFQVTSGSSVKLTGVLWGGNGAGTLFVYSPLGNVIRELGPLTTH
ncbi:MAG TPA: hypothetical protein VGQ69_08545 [Gemmatimonadales bacterium]|jgi:hypothetical protein|nr:hypothetical protein [Gemmatimonadales bacterium]